MLEGVETEGAVAMGEVKFARGGECEVVANYAVDFVAEGLDCDYRQISVLMTLWKG